MQKLRQQKFHKINLLECLSELLSTVLWPLFLWVKRKLQTKVRAHSQPKNSEWKETKHDLCYQRAGPPQVEKQG